MASEWTAADIPDQSGRLAVVTGANSGLGPVSARAMGALPTLYPAAAADVPGVSFVGPDGFMEQRGHPRIVTASGKAYDEPAWRRLWEASEELTGVHYQFPSG
jgi:hypothetical protein